MDILEQRFQVNLSGIIDLLSQHLYSGPQVFVRELLQNGVDAITARAHDEPNCEKRLTVEILSNRLEVTDSGIGLTEEEIHRFLSVIGQSSKRDLMGKQLDYIGQFGIGLLACFMVSDEITLQTKSANSPLQSWQWTGKPDGTYSVEQIDLDMPIGTRVILNANNQGKQYLEAKELLHWLNYYGKYLPYEINFINGKQHQRISALSIPWDYESTNKSNFNDKALTAAQDYFNGPFFDIIPFQTLKGKVKGIAYISAQPGALNGQQHHQIFLKGMRLSDTAHNILPEWAFFVNTIINAEDLSPTASRESLYQDETLAQCCEELGEQLIEYLIDMSTYSEQKFSHFVEIHQLSLKSLAAKNDYFCKKITPHLSFLTSKGRMKLIDYIAQNAILSIINNIDEFRQISQISNSKSQCVLCTGFAFDQEIIYKYAQLEGLEVKVVDPQSTVSQLQDVTQQGLLTFLKRINTMLNSEDVLVTLKHFEPVEVAALFVSSEKQMFISTAKKIQEQTDDFWGGIIDGVTDTSKTYQSNELCLNASNELVLQLSQLDDAELLKTYLQVLYVQSLLMGNFAVGDKELSLLNQGLLYLMNTGLNSLISNNNTCH